MPKKLSTLNRKNSKIQKDKLSEYREIFDILDKNKEGIISIDDIIKLRRIFYYPISEMNINKMINEIDKYGDGEFDFSKFIAFMKKQIEYIDENDEKTILKTIKEEFKTDYLGNKRKRQKIKNKETLICKKNKMPNIDKEKSEDDIIIIDRENDENESSFSSDSFWGDNKERKLENTFTNDNYWNKNKKNKLENRYNNIQINKSAIFENLNVKMIVEKKGENNNFNDKIINQYYSFNNNNNGKNNENNNICINKIKSENNEKRQNKSPKKINESKNDLKSIDSFIIMKKDLPIELVYQIEQKDKENFIPQIKFNYNNYFNNSLNLSSGFISISKKCHINDTNLGEEYSFSSEFNIDSINKLNYGICNNSRLEKNPTINSTDKNKNFIDDYASEKFNDQIREKLMNIPFNNNSYFKKDIPYYQKKKRFEIKSENSLNSNSFYNQDNDKFGNYICLNEGIDIADNSNNKLKDDNKINNPNQNGKDKICIKKSEIESKLQEIIKPKSIQILNTFQLEYKRNRRKERIIKKSTEIPYLIIIEKNEINVDEIETMGEELINEQKGKENNFVVPPKNKREKNENKSFLLENFQIEIYNNMIKSISKESKKGRKNEKGKKENKKYKSQDYKPKNKRGRKKKENIEKSIDKKTVYSQDISSKKKNKKKIKNIEDEMFYWEIE